MHTKIEHLQIPKIREIISACETEDELKEVVKLFNSKEIL
jgi:hypothetical protein